MPTIMDLATQGKLTVDNLRVVCTDCPAIAKVHGIFIEPSYEKKIINVWSECHGKHTFKVIPHDQTYIDSAKGVLLDKLNERGVSSATTLFAGFRASLNEIEMLNKFEHAANACPGLAMGAEAVQQVERLATIMLERVREYELNEKAKPQGK